MIVLIDNYDSFSYNVFQLIGSVEPDIKVVRNDEYTVEEIEKMKPEALILSPGPGKPSDAGICIEAIRYFAGKIPILGICLGHQAICEAFGGRVSYAKELMHGKKKTIYTVGKSKIFEGLGDSFPIFPPGKNAGDTINPSVDTAILPAGGTSTAASSAVRSEFAKCALNTWSINSDVCFPPAPCAIVTVLFSIMFSFFLFHLNLW